MTEIEQTDSKIICYHCGDICKDFSISIDNKFFCCSGCKTVYEILNQNQLCNYYNLDQTPGISPKSLVFNKFEHLNDENLVNRIIEFKDDKISKVTFFIPQMHCSSCIWLLENLNRLNENIIYSSVNFVRKELSIKFNHHSLSLKDVVILITSIGYAPQLNLETAEKRPEAKSNKSLYYKIGIAGFCFGNIMLLSFPEYLSIDITETFFRKFFAYLNLLLALPVFFYSASDYFISAYKGLIKKIINIDVPISLGILVLFLRSGYDVVFQQNAGYFDSLSGLVFFLLIGKLLQEKTYDALNFERDYKSYFPLAVTIRQNEIEKTIPVSNLMIGNRVVIRQNEIIPADAILMNGEGFIDYSFVTGESNPVHKVSGEKIFAGGRQISGVIELEVVKEVSQSYLTQLWNNDSLNKSIESNFTNFSNSISKYFTIFILIVASLAALFWYSISVETALNVFTSVLIVACPCALALSTPFTLGNTMRIFGRNKFYLKNSFVVEKMAKINSIVFDKTGTITEPNQSDVLYNGTILNKLQQKMIKSLVRNSTHPISKKIYNSIDQDELFPVTDYKEQPGKGISGFIFGHFVKIGNTGFVNANDKNEINNPLQTKTFISVDSEILGAFIFSNSYRAGISESIKNLSSEYDLSLLSGDNSGEKENLLKIFTKESQLYFKQSPQNKLDYIESLQKENKNVLMIGDGLNDAGALSQSNVGISVTNDVSNFTPACDAILESKKITLIPEFLKFSKISLKIIYLNFIVSFFYNIIGLSFAVEGLLSPLIAAILMPLSSITVVLIATLSTNIIAKKRGLLSQ